MLLSAITAHSGIPVLAFFQATQLNLFESFLTNAVSGINSTGITSGMQNMAYVILLIGFLWQVYQSAMHGGDVRGLGTSLIKYVVTAVIVMNYQTIFTTINQGFVNGGNWISNASGAGNLLQNWASDLKTQFSQIGFQKMWGLITGSIAGLIDAILIFVAYILYPVVIVIFGFFYILYGSILYIFGPIVLALMPLGATNRLAKSYAENLFVWNAWPVLYGGFGALLSAVQMGQLGQMLNQGDFLGGLGNLEGSFLIGFASIIYSLAIAVIPFIAKRIVSGDVGATAGALIGAAATALTAGIAAVEGVGAGAAATGAGAGPSGASALGAVESATARRSVSGGTGNVPAAMQKAQDSQASKGAMSTERNQALDGSAYEEAGNISGPTAEGHASQMRENLSAAVGQGAEYIAQSRNSGATDGTPTSITGNGDIATGETYGGISGGRSSPSFRGHSLASWGAFHAARLGTQGAIASGTAISGAGRAVIRATTNPRESSGRIGAAAGRAAGSVANAAVNAGQAVGAAANAVSHPIETAQRVGRSAGDSLSGAANKAATTAKNSMNALKANFSSAYGEARRSNSSKSTNDSD
jgi:hypothetical protein